MVITKLLEMGVNGTKQKHMTTIKATKTIL